MTLLPIAGHRGFSANAPENTLEAFKQASLVGAFWIECDVQLTQDNKVVVFHDQNLKRCTGLDQDVKASVFDDLMNLDVGSWFSTSYKNTKIPTLKQTLLLCIEHKLSINIELKIFENTTASDLKALCLAVLDDLKLCQFPEDKLIISSFSVKALQCIYDLNQLIHLGYCCESLNEETKEILNQLPFYSAHLNWHSVSFNDALYLEKQGIKLVIWTLNALQLLPFFHYLNTYLVITDQPKVFVEAVNKKVLS